VRGKFESIFIVDEELCGVLLHSEDENDVVGSLVPYSTAVRALMDIVKVKSGEVSIDERFSLYRIFCS
jgi:hypothetical protein